LRGDVFWIVTEHGFAADYVENLQHDPRVRVNVGAAGAVEQQPFSRMTIRASACERSDGPSMTRCCERSARRC
jgi:hypothetical protein